MEQNKEPRLSEYYPIYDREKYSLIAFSMTQSTRIVEVEQFAGINVKNLICDDGAKKNEQKKNTHTHTRELYKQTQAHSCQLRKKIEIASKEAKHQCIVMALRLKRVNEKSQ